MRLPTDTADSDGPNLTPVIDVVFLLLIFFLVATRFDQEERELDVELPEVVQAQPIAMTQGLIINVSRDGEYTVVRKEYSEEQLAALIREAKRNNPHQTALVRSHGDGALRHTARVLGLCKREKLKATLAALVEH